jgi:polyphenol oxidase
MNRRQFVYTLGQGSAALIMGMQATRLWGQGHAQPVDCSPPSHGAPKHITFDTSAQLLPRKSVWDLTGAELTRLQKAYQAMRDLNTKTPNDPRGWMQQANTHCFNCSGGYDPSNVEIHGSWWFFPWHRCYLHVHERILGKLIGDPTFRLAYWDWDTYSGTTPIHAIVPPPFLAAGPLFDAYRGAGASDVIPSRITGPAAMKIVLGTKSTAAFMGKLSDPPNNKYYAGAMENSPHGPVHLWTGDANPGQPTEPAGCSYPNTATGQPVAQSPYCLDMGVLSTAAQDPIFFAHHSNIDRLWDVWRGMPGSQGNWKDASWRNHQFNFYDENGDWVYVTVADVLEQNEQTNLRYTYDNPSAASALAATPKAKTTKATAAMAALKPLVVTSATTAIVVGTKPHAKSVAVPQDHRNNLRTFAALDDAAPRHYVLHIDGLTLPPNEGTIIDVFAGEPSANRDTPIGPSFVGTFSIVPSGSHHNHVVVRDAVFELRSETAALLADQKILKVTLVPKLVNGKEPSKSSLTYKKIYLSVE